MKQINTYKTILKECITRWYKNAEIDYGITGRFLGAVVHGNDLEINWEEAGEALTYIVAWFEDYTPEQVYDIWMEQP